MPSGTKKARRSRSLEPYRGRLELSQVVEGSRLAASNAASLLDDARALFAMGRFPTAAFLAIIAIEEYGKLPILQRIVASSEIDLVKRWREYRSHTSKNSAWVLPHMVDHGPKPLEQFAAAFSPDSWHQDLLDEVKQLSLYTDCVEDGEWSDPNVFMPRESAEWLIGIAGRLITTNVMNEEQLSLSVIFHSKMSQATSPEEGRAIFAEYLREVNDRGYGSISERVIQDLLEGKIDLRGAKPAE